MYNISATRLILDNIFSGAMRSLGGILLYIAFMVVIGSIASQLAGPYIQQIIGK